MIYRDRSWYASITYLSYVAGVMPTTVHVNSVSNKYNCDSRPPPKNAHILSSRLSVRHHTHCRLAQYNARISTNSKASLSPGKCVATPACTTHRYRSHTHVDHDTSCTDKARRIYMKPPHPGRRSEISPDISQQNQ